MTNELDALALRIANEISQGRSDDEEFAIDDWWIVENARRLRAAWEKSAAPTLEVGEERGTAEGRSGLECGGNKG